MCIYSWNMLFRNAEEDRAFDAVKSAPWDIFCLQEVSEEFLARLKTLSAHLAYAPEVDRVRRGSVSTQYVVILSRYPIKTEGRIPLPYREPQMPRRGWAFMRFMARLDLWAIGVGNRHALYADLDTPHGKLRVFNLHLALANPAARAEEFERAMLERDRALPAIVCGDLNVLEKPHITPLSWLFGGTLGDALLHRRERARIESRFAAHDFHNPLRGRATHAVSRSQLDHILISPHFAVRHAEVVADRHGSDHHPIFVEADWAAA